MTFRRISGWKRLEGGTRSVKLDGYRQGITRIPIMGLAGSEKRKIAHMLKTIHGKNYENMEYTENAMDLVPYKNLVRGNAIKAMVALVEEVESRGFKCTVTATATSYEQVRSSIEDRDRTEIPGEVWSVLKKMWENPKFTHAARLASKYELYQEAEYYFNSIDRISLGTYMPSSYDVLLCRSKMNCILETPLQHNLWLLEVAPIGSQSHLKRILQFFEKESALIYCVDVSSYDQVEKSEGRNLLLKALEEFRWISTHEFMKETGMIVIFTKRDIFKNKLSHTSLKVCFPEYPGTDTFEQASSFITKQFRSKVAKSNCFHSIYVSCNDIYLKDELKRVKDALFGCFVQLDLIRIQVL